MSQDSQLQQSVMAEFNWEPSVSASHIGVTANAGVVTLSGYVDNYAAKHAAETAARRVKGVKAVVGAIEVRLPFDINRSDEEIAAAAIERLAWNVFVPKDSVTVKIERGWVTLTGQVDSWHQQEAAERDIRPLHGVIGVSNQTTIKPLVDPANLDDDIMHALDRSGRFDPKHINVIAEGRQILQTGAVNAVIEPQTADATASATPGATSVKNDIVVA